MIRTSSGGAGTDGAVAGTGPGVSGVGFEDAVAVDSAAVDGGGAAGESVIEYTRRVGLAAGDGAARRGVALVRAAAPGGGDGGLAGTGMGDVAPAVMGEPAADGGGSGRGEGDAEGEDVSAGVRGGAGGRRGRREERGVVPFRFFDPDDGPEATTFRRVELFLDAAWKTGARKIARQRTGWCDSGRQRAECYTCDHIGTESGQMQRVGARELKQHTGEVIARIQRGERLLLTHRGSPIAVISPIDQDAVAEAIAREARRVESLGWLALSETAFGFWDNEDDTVWDKVETK